MPSTMTRTGPAWPPTRPPRPVAARQANTPAAVTSTYDTADRLDGETHDTLGRVSLAPSNEATGIGSYNSAKT